MKQLVLALCLGLPAGPCLAQPIAAPAQAARDYLEGIWLIGEKPDQGACVSHWYRSNQVEFEFRKSGGRLLMFEPPDLYTAAAIADVRVDGDEIGLVGRKRDGETDATPMRLRRLDADRFQWVPSGGEAAAGDIAYRCGPADRSVSGDVAFGSLALLTPVLSGAETFPEILPGEDDRKVCSGEAPDPEGTSRRALQFELLGPAHYWVFGDGGGKRRFIEFDRVRTVRQSGDRTLTLEMEEHPKGAKGWSTPSGRRYSLTVIQKGEHFEIPELAATYVRCRPDEAASYGMHRMN